MTSSDSEIERIARCICSNYGHDPDQTVYRGVPANVPGGWVVPGQGHPQWTFYAEWVSAVLQVQKADAEAIARIFDVPQMTGLPSFWVPVDNGGAVPV